MRGMAPVRVALTGASGYTGGRLLEALRARGDEVAVLVRPRSRHASACARAPRGSWRATSATRRPRRRLVEGADAVLHVAAVYRTAGHPDSYYREVNVGGTERLLEAAARAGVRRFVHTSTVGVHGHVEHPPADETRALSPRATSTRRRRPRPRRWRCDFHRDAGRAGGGGAPGAIYGPGETRLLKLFRAIARGRYAIVGDGPHLLPPGLHRRPRGGLPAGPRPARGGRRGVPDLRPALRLAGGAGRARREAHGRPRAALPDPGPARCSGRGTWSRRCACRSASSRRCTGGASTSGRRAGRSRSRRRAGSSATSRRWTSTRASRARRRRTGRPGGCERRGACGGRAARGVLARSWPALVAATLGLDLPRAVAGRVLGRRRDLLRDGVEPGARRRPALRGAATSRGSAREYPSGPQGLFLKRASGGLTVDAAAGFPWLRRVRPDEGAALLREGLRVPARSPPRSWPLLGTRGLHARERPAALGRALARLRDRCGGAGSGPWPALGVAVVAPAAHGDAALPRLADAGDPRPGAGHGGARGLGGRAGRCSRPVLFGVAGYLKPPNLLMAAPLGLEPLLPRAGERLLGPGLGRRLGETLRRGVVLVADGGQPLRR